jgi:hypothetical protein
MRDLAIKNPPFTDDFPVRTSIYNNYKGFPIATFDFFNGDIIKLATDTAELPSSLLYPQLLGDTNAAS